MIGDNIDDDIAGALACGVRAVLVDRNDRHPDYDGERVRGLAELPPLLGSGRRPRQAAARSAASMAERSSRSSPGS